MTSRIGIRVVLFAAVVITIGCDRVTKHIAQSALADTGTRSFLSDTIRLQYAENTGGFLGLGGDLHPVARTALFEVGTGMMLLAVVAWAIRWRVAGWSLIGLGLFVTGGASNWFDRLARGTVVDFLVLGVGPLRTGIFNVADVAIMAGVALFALAQLRGSAADLPLPEPADRER